MLARLKDFANAINQFLDRHKLAVSMVLYAIFVWSLAWLRHDYMWIIGDDPNLLNQALLLSRGNTPNLDFGSGYPGLSLYPHSILINLLGPLPVTEHIYSALLATFIGLLFFMVLRNKFNPYLISIVLLFIYFNSHFNNPSPNPGYGFEIFFILGLFLLHSSMKKNASLPLLIMGACLCAVSFGFKQYGIFAPIIFLLYSSLLYTTSAARSSRRKYEKLAIIALNVLPLLLYSYLYLKESVLVSTEIDGRIAINYLVFNLPWLGVILLLFRDNSPEERQLTFGNFVLANFAFNMAFIASVLLIMAAIYGLNGEIFSALKIILFDAPKLINRLIIYLQPYSFGVLKTVLIGLLITLAPVIAQRFKSGTRLTLFVLLILVVLSHYIKLQLNEGSTLYLVAIYAAFIVIAVKRYGLNNDRLLLYLSISPILSILTPFPDYAYHLAIVILFGLWVCSPAIEQKLSPNISAYGPSFFALGLVAMYGLVLVKADVYLGRVDTYSVNGLQFVSGDKRWADEIERSRQVMEGKEKSCINHACLYIMNFTASGK